MQRSGRGTICSYRLAREAKLPRARRTNDVESARQSTLSAVVNASDMCTSRPLRDQIEKEHRAKVATTTASADAHLNDTSGLCCVSQINTDEAYRNYSEYTRVGENLVFEDGLVKEAVNDRMLALNPDGSGYEWSPHSTRRWPSTRCRARRST